MTHDTGAERASCEARHVVRLDFRLRTQHAITHAFIDAGGTSLYHTVQHVAHRGYTGFVNSYCIVHTCTQI